jgi:hypothetical protein
MSAPARSRLVVTCASWSLTLAIALVAPFAACSSSSTGSTPTTDASPDRVGAQEGGSSDSAGIQDVSSVDGPCAICDEAYRCCVAAVGPSGCGAFSGAQCLSEMGDAQDYYINACNLEVQDAIGTGTVCH